MFNLIGKITTSVTLAVAGGLYPEIASLFNMSDLRKSKIVLFFEIKD